MIPFHYCCKVYIWNRLTSDLIVSLRGHTGPVNAVAWSPTVPGMLASASDDRTVRLWVAPEPLVQGRSKNKSS